MAKWFGASFYDSRDRKVDRSTPTQASFLRPWIRCFTTIISVWWKKAANQRSRKQNSSGNSETKATFKRVRNRPTHSASVAFSWQENENEKINQKVNDVTEGVELVVP